MTPNGKGSQRRGDSESEAKYQANYASVFGKCGKMIDLTIKKIKRKNKRGAK